MISDQLAGGVMDLLVLTIVSHTESYGYAITHLLDDCGLDGVNEATVYTSLRRLESKNLVLSRRELAENGRARKYYRLSPTGDATLRDGIGAWTALSRAVDKVLANYPVDSHDRRR